MKNLQSFSEFVYESESIDEASRWKGKEIYPNWVKPSDIGGFVKKESDLVVGQDYVLLDLGMNVWQAEYEYIGKVGPMHQFKVTDQFAGDTEPMEYSDKDLKAAIKDLEIAVMESESVNENKSQEKKIEKWLKKNGEKVDYSNNYDWTFVDDGGMEFDVKVEDGVVTLYDGEEETTMGYKEFMRDWMK